MQTSLPKSLLTITILLILLALVSLATLFLSSFGANPAGRLPGDMPQGANFRPENGNLPQSGEFQGGERQPGSGTFPQRSASGAFNLFSLTRAFGLSGQVMIYLNYGAAVIGAGLAALAAFWVWKKKKAGLNLALVLAILFLLGALPGVFSGLRMMNAAAILRYALNILSAGAALALLATGILPSVRDEVS
ncbi:MAG: hypothetical protein L6461_03695 [Anaerolineae bacterium]|nr:hypothetical protein [Anaerolineae bacterium]